jgi:L-seryl-tRNA(Ser) seleniumtransferase
MANTGEDNVYTRLGARPVINAGGNTTVWGGSTPSPEVMRAMQEAGNSFVEMEELLATAGARIADLVGADAAYPTAGAYAALVLSTAACITGNDPEKAAQIPDLGGLKSEIVLQQRHRYGYDRAYTIPGSRLVLAGDEEGTTADQLIRAIGPDTAAVAYLVSADKDESTVGLEETVEIAHARGIPVIADAAAQIYPLDSLRRNAQSSDLVCFGGKYMGAPHSTGFVCGKKDMIEAVTAHGFIGPRPFGRGMKMDRQEIIGLVTAIDMWINTDHEERLVRYGARFSAIERAVQGVSGVRETKVVPTNNFVGLMLHVVLNTDKLGKSAEEVYDEVLNGAPRIRLATEGDDTLTVNVHTLNEGEEHIIADRLRDVLDV